MDIRKLSPGDRILDYRILERLGEGGFGEVFRAEHEVLGRIVAIKVPRDQSSLTALRHEGVVQASIEHPNIVRTLELSISHDPPYVVMEYVQGSSLAEIIRREGALPWKRAGRVLLEVARALAHAHSQGVVHGDVKPGNVLVEPGRDGRVLLTDFGLGRVFEGPNGSIQISRSLELATSGAEVHGTIRYLAPELLRGETADERADLYSFGVLVFEVLTGRLPEGREVPSDLVRELPTEFDRIFARTFTRRERRPRSLAPTIDELKELVDPDGKASTKAEPRPELAAAKMEIVRAIPANAPEDGKNDAGRLCKRHASAPTVHAVAQPISPARSTPAAPSPGATSPGATPLLHGATSPGATSPGATSPGATSPGATSPAPAPFDPGFVRWRDAVLAQLRERMTVARTVSVSDGQGFDLCFGVSADGEPHHRVYALLLPLLDANVARTTVAAARQIFEREKGIWEKEVTFCVIAQQVREIDQVLWAFKSFSMGWWRRRRMMLQDLEGDRLYAAELGCDPRGNPLKRAFLDASAESIKVVPQVTAEPLTLGPARRRSVRGTAWGAALALVMAIGLMGSVMAIEYASQRVRRGRRCGKPTPALTTDASRGALSPEASPGALSPVSPETSPGAVTPASPEASPGAVTPASPETSPGAVTPASPEASPGAVTPASPEASPGAVTPASPETRPGAVAPRAPESSPGAVTPPVPARAPDAFTPNERRRVLYFF